MVIVSVQPVGGVTLSGWVAKKSYPDGFQANQKEPIFVVPVLCNVMEYVKGALVWLVEMVADPDKAARAGTA